MLMQFKNTQVWTFLQKTLLQLGHSFTDSMAKTLNRSHNKVFVVRRKTLDRAVWQLVSTSCRNRYQALNGLRLHQEIPGLRLRQEISGLRLRQEISGLRLHTQTEVMPGYTRTEVMPGATRTEVTPGNIRTEVTYPD